MLRELGKENAEDGVDDGVDEVLLKLIDQIGPPRQRREDPLGSSDGFGGRRRVGERLVERWLDR